MTPTQPNKDQEAAGVAELTGRPAKGGKTTNRAVGADAATAADRSATTHP